MNNLLHPSFLAGVKFKFGDHEKAPREAIVNILEITNDQKLTETAVLVGCYDVVRGSKGLRVNFLTFLPF